jgi:Putative Ig domain
MVRVNGRIRWVFLSLALVTVLGFPAAAAARNVLSPFALGHAYRHGVVPLRPGRDHAGSNAAATSPSDLNFGGGIDGVGVTTGAEKVYLVFWGSQWGSQSTDSRGYTTLSGDPSSIAPDLQAFFKGLGTGSELWSGVMTQYCEGVTTGSQSCPSTASHVAYPTGGALAGVWVDESSAAPLMADGNQIGAEAVAAAGHFGNTSSTANRDAQYVVVSPTGTYPDGFYLAGFCAWHDYTGDTTLSGGAVNSPFGPLAFTNLPYIPDAGTSCGQNFVNSGSAGNNDGVTIVAGHEYAETITDQFPAGGWTDSSGNENGDKCAWISSGQGASQNITLTTGTFAVQSTWANDFNGAAGGCEVTHPIVANGGANTVTVTDPPNQTGTVGSPASLQIKASDSASGQTLTYSATGLPAGLLINSSTGLISGTPTTTGSSSVTVTATDTTGASGSASFTWTINAGTNDFSITASPTSASVRRGGSARFTISTATTSGSAQSISLSESGPNGVTASFSATSVTSGGSSTMTLSTSSTMTPGTYTITVTGTGTSTHHSTTISLTVRKR